MLIRHQKLANTPHLPMVTREESPPSSLLPFANAKDTRPSPCSQIMPPPHAQRLGDDVHEREGDEHDCVAREERYPRPAAEEKAAERVGDELAEEEDCLEAEEDGCPGKWVSK